MSVTDCRAPGWNRAIGSGAAAADTAAAAALAAAHHRGASAAALLALFGFAPEVFDQLLLFLAEDALRLGQPLVGAAGPRVPARPRLAAAALRHVVPPPRRRRAPRAPARARSPAGARRRSTALRSARCPTASSVIRNRLPSRMNVTAVSFRAQRGFDSMAAVFMSSRRAFVATS